MVIIIDWLCEKIKDVPEWDWILRNYLSTCFPNFSVVSTRPLINMMKAEGRCATSIIEIIKYYGDLSRVNIEHVQNSRKAFKTKYEHEERALNHFKKFVDKCITDFQESPKTFYSLSFPIVQSSGMGKTRLVLESGRKTMHVVYGCLRDSRSTGYPVGNENLMNFLRNNNETEKLMEFLAIVYITFFSMWHRYKTKFPSVKFPMAKLEGDDIKFQRFWKFTIDFYNKMSKLERKKIIQEFRFWQKREDAPEVLFAIDEASDLVKLNPGDKVSRFVNLREAFADLDSRKLVLVFMDTSSIIVHAQPKEYRDFRPKLLPPFYEILAMNCRPANFNLEMDRETELIAAFSYGRPLWYAYFFKGDAHFLSAVPRAIRFTRLKLAFTDDTQNLLGDDAAAAVASFRFGISGISYYPLASDLMKSHMAVGISIWGDRPKMQIEYIPEPLLGEAACQLLHGHQQEKHEYEYHTSEEKVCHVLKKFTSKCLAGLVDAGSVKEITARIILSLAYDHVHLGQDINSTHLFSDAISVKEFLEALLSKEYLRKYSEFFGCQPVNFKEIPILDGRVCFTSWIRMGRIPNDHIPEMFLKQCFHMRCAVSVPLSHGDFELIIPVRMTNGRFTFIEVQVGNIWSRFTDFDLEERVDAEESVMENAVKIFIDVDHTTFKNAMEMADQIVNIFAQSQTGNGDSAAEKMAKLVDGLNELDIGMIYGRARERLSESILDFGGNFKKFGENLVEDFKSKVRQSMCFAGLGDLLHQGQSSGHSIKIQQKRD